MQVDYRALVWFACGCVAVLVTFDLVVGFAFSIPTEAREPAGSLQRYFNYGESIEGKLSRTVGREGLEAAAIVRAGWISTELYPPPDDWGSGGTRVALYGMSFTQRIARAMDEMKPSLAIMGRGGPGASLNHSFALFEADPYRADADHVVVGILSSSVPYLQAMSGLGYTLESPAPHTFPKFTLIEGQLKRLDPVIQEHDEFIDAFRHRSDRWEAYLDGLRRHDPYWDSFIFDRSVSDASTLAKLIRRAWHRRNIARRQSAVYSSADGYDTKHPSIAATPAVLDLMHEACVSDGQQLTVILLHARGEPGHLDRWLRVGLENRGINVISSVDLFSSLDALNFEGDGHYLPRWDRELAAAVIAVVSE